MSFDVCSYFFRSTPAFYQSFAFFVIQAIFLVIVQGNSLDSFMNRLSFLAAYLFNSERFFNSTSLILRTTSLEHGSFQRFSETDFQILFRGRRRV